MKNLADLVARHLRGPDHGWSMGVPGAIGEFMYDEGEPIRIETAGQTIRGATSRGAIEVTLNTLTRCIAYRQRSTCSTGGTLQAVAFCLPEHEAELDPHSCLTEIGRDESSLGTRAAPGTVFDLGLASKHVRFCVRVSDAALLDGLRERCGQSVFAPDGTVLGAIKKASPPRVICSKLGRIEVYGDIPEQGTTSPRGPHTHLLPQLLGKDSLLSPIPNNLVAPLILYPAHPSRDKYGDPKPFDQTAQDNLEGLMEAFGVANTP